MAWEEENPWYGGFYLVHGQFIQQGRQILRGESETDDLPEQKSNLNVVSAILALGGLMLATTLAKKIGKK